MAKSEELVTRVVKGKKPFLYRDPETGVRSRVAPGRQVKVRPSTARNHKDVLEDPEVLKAKLKALEEEQKRLEEEEETRKQEREGTADKPTPNKPAPNQGGGK